MIEKVFINLPLKESEALIAVFAEVFKDFKPTPFDFTLEPRIFAEAMHFIEMKQQTDPEWKYPKKQLDYLDSRKADLLLTRHAQERGFSVDLTDIPGHDFAIFVNEAWQPPERIFFETKRMRSMAQQEIVFGTPFKRTNSCNKWYTYHMIIAWTVTSDGYFKPWALVSNQLFCQESWDKFWKVNRTKSGVPCATDACGKHLSLKTLPLTRLYSIL